MSRRELLKHISLITGAAVVGADFFLTGCKRANADTVGLFTKADIALLDEIAETIIPRTQTPGAKDAQVGTFIATFVADCYDETEQKIIKQGLKATEEASQTTFGKSFTDITSQQRYDILHQAALEAKALEKTTANDGAPHYFTLFQQLTLLGFFTSEPGFTQVLRYEIVPGKYEACIDYQPGEKAWAN